MIETIRKINPKLPVGKAVQISAAIYKYATTNGIDPKLVAAVIATESSFKPQAVGPVGELGLMQLRPEFHGTSLNLVDMDYNIGTGAAYLAALKTIFKGHYGDMRWIEHYNRGPSAKPKKFPYYNKVMKFYVQFGGHIEQATKGNRYLASYQDSGRSGRGARRGTYGGRQTY